MKQEKKVSLALNNLFLNHHVILQFFLKREKVICVFISINLHVAGLLEKYAVDGVLNVK